MIHSFLLIGQSNMAGRGYLQEAEKINSEHIKVLRNGRWQNMYKPINPDRSFSGVNLAESFAEKYAEKYQVDVGLICCADGGTSMDQWREGGLLFDHAVYQARLASRTSTIAGVLWHQGEADCRAGRYMVYEQKLVAMFEALKKELNLYDVPFLLGALGDFLSECSADAELKNYQYVNEALKKVAQVQEMTAFVSAEGLGSNPDKLHFSAKALYEFGQRYFEAFEATRNSDKIFEEKNGEDTAVRSAMELM